MPLLREPPPTFASRFRPRRTGEPWRVQGMRHVTLREPSAVVVDVPVEGCDTRVRDEPQGVADQPQQVPVVRDEHQRAGERLQRGGERMTHVQIEMVRGLVEQEKIGPFEDQQRKGETGLLPARQGRHTSHGRLVPEPERSEEVTHFLLAQVGGDTAHELERGAKRVELLDPVLREVADPRVPRVHDRSGVRFQASRDAAKQSRLAHPVRAEQRDPVSGRQGHRYFAQHRTVTVPEFGLLQRRYGPGGTLRFEELEGESLLRAERFDHLHPLERLEPTLRLPRLACLVAEAFDERLHPCSFVPETFGGSQRVLDLDGTEVFECTVVPGVDRYPTVPDQGHPIDDRIQKLPVVGNEQERAAVAPQPALQPDHRVEVEMVRGLVEKEQLRRCGEGPCERGAHSPSAGKSFQGPGLLTRGKAESAQDSTCLRFRGVTVDGFELRMGRRHACGVAARLGIREPSANRCDPGIAAYNIVDERDVPRRRFLGDGRGGDAGRERDIASVRLELAKEQCEETRLAGAVRSHHPEFLPTLNRQVCIIENPDPAAAKFDAVQTDHGTLSLEPASLVIVGSVEWNPFAEKTSAWGTTTLAGQFSSAGVTINCRGAAPALRDRP